MMIMMMFIQINYGCRGKFYRNTMTQNHENIESTIFIRIILYVGREGSRYCNPYICIHKYIHIYIYRPAIISTLLNIIVIIIFTLKSNSKEDL
jgi:hypothetical protein